jgi:spore coat polysaccharide biosynthesis protein SpsF (cytidylyltransferase family)
MISDRECSERLVADSFNVGYLYGIRAGCNRISPSVIVHCQAANASAESEQRANLPLAVMAISLQARSTGMTAQTNQTVALIDLAVSSAKHAEQTNRVEAALRRLDGLTLLEWCIRRLSESTLIDTIVVTGPPHYRELISNTGLCNARWMPSALRTPARRAMELMERLNASWMVFASPLCPFTDPALIDRLISRGWSNPEADFVGFLSLSQPTFSLQSLGLVAEMCSSAAMKKIEQDKLLDEPMDVPELIRSHPSLFTSKLIPLPVELSQRSLRFEMQTEEDWDRVHNYLEAAGDDLSWQRLAQVAERSSFVT